jgi:hypothetical protein
MNWRSLFVVCFMVAVCPTYALGGQDPTYQGRLFGGIGFGNYYEDEGSIGTGVSYRAGAERRAFPRIGFEAEVIGLAFKRGDSFASEGNSQFALANAALYLTTSRIQPYLKLGLGASRTRYHYSLPGTPVLQRSKNGAAAGLGAGIRFFANRHWSISPEVRVIGAAGGYTLFGYLSVSAAYHW